MDDSYVIIARDTRAELTVRKSRFLAIARRAPDEPAARAVIDECRRAARDARHHCSAYALGPLAEITRSSDDGEPAKTAGMPILEAIRGRALSDVVVVVTRWFGGIKLGTGGLARAYADAANSALDAAGVATRERVRYARLAVAHDQIGRLENELRTRPDARRIGLSVDQVTYGRCAELFMSVPLAGWDATQDLLAELGAAAPAPLGSGWRDSAQP